MSETKAEERYEKHFEWARAQLKGFEESKQGTIRELASRLEKEGMPLNLICAAVAHQLEGFVSDQYVRRCLDGKYKQESKLRETKICETSGAKSGMATTATFSHLKNNETQILEFCKSAPSPVNDKPPAGCEECETLRAALSRKNKHSAPFTVETELEGEDYVPLIVEVFPAEREVTVKIDRRRLK